jgi:flagellar hook-associated protein 3 FlgL
MATGEPRITVRSLRAIIVRPSNHPTTDAESSEDLMTPWVSALGDLDQALGRLLETRTSLGARMNTVETQSRINEDQLLQVRTALSEIQDLDYAEAISRFNLQQTALQAAQQTFVQVQRLSLFNFM